MADRPRRPRASRSPTSPSVSARSPSSSWRSAADPRHAQLGPDRRDPRRAVRTAADRRCQHPGSRLDRGLRHQPDRQRRRPRRRPRRLRGPARAAQRPRRPRQFEDLHQALSVLEQLRDLEQFRRHQDRLGSFDMVNGAPANFTVAQIARKLPSENAEAIVAAEKTFDQVVDRSAASSIRVTPRSARSTTHSSRTKGRSRSRSSMTRRRSSTFCCRASTGHQLIDIVVYNFPEQKIPAEFPRISSRSSARSASRSAPRSTR